MSWPPTNGAARQGSNLSFRRAPIVGSGFSCEPAIARSLTNWRADRALGRGFVARRLERAIGVIYRPESERQSHYFDAHLSRQFDAMVWFEETSAVDPLPGAAPKARRTSILSDCERSIRWICACRAASVALARHTLRSDKRHWLIARNASRRQATAMMKEA